MKIHRLKIDPRWLASILSGEKTYEIRFHDRDYQAGDLVEFEKDELRYVITHILRQCDFPEGLRDGYSILSIKLYTP